MPGRVTLHRVLTTSPEKVYSQAVLQGAFILTKASSERATASACVDHLIRYIEMLFNRREDLI